MKVTDNYNKDWENITDPVIFYSTWLQKDKDAILSKIEFVISFISSSTVFGILSPCFILRKCYILK